MLTDAAACTARAASRLTTSSASFARCAASTFACLAASHSIIFPYRCVPPPAAPLRCALVAASSRCRRFACSSSAFAACHASSRSSVRRGSPSFAFVAGLRCCAASLSQAVPWNLLESFGISWNLSGCATDARKRISTSRCLAAAITVESPCCSCRLALSPGRVELRGNRGVQKAIFVRHAVYTPLAILGQQETGCHVTCFEACGGRLPRLRAAAPAFHCGRH